jgi:hypothetical protein
MNHTQQIKLLLNGLAEYYGVTLTPSRLAMYAEDLEDLPIDVLGMAIRTIRRNPAHKFFPLPSAIREEILGSAKDEALEAANRLIEAMHKYGYTNPERAKAHMGDLAWHIVEREGGWTNLCQRVQSDDLPTLKAQFREFAAATLRRGASGLGGRAPMLARSDKKAELTSVSALLPTISKGKDSA